MYLSLIADFREGGPSSAWGRLAAMVTIALRATSHVAAWLVWQSMRVSLLDDLAAPAPPHLEARRAARRRGFGPLWHSYTESAMPIYEYRCEKGHTFEVLQRMSDEPVEKCEVC